MTFQECLSFSPFEIIWQQLSSVYPDDKGHKEAYREVYDNILSIAPVKSKYRVRIDFVEEFAEWHVYGVDDSKLCDIPKDEGGVDENHPKANELIQYAIEYESRAEWAGMLIDSATTCEHSTLDIAVHCLWEMTFAGFKEDAVIRQKEKIKESVKSIKDNPEDFVEVKDGVFCHKDMVDTMRDFLDSMNERGHE